MRLFLTIFTIPHLIVFMILSKDKKIIKDLAEYVDCIINKNHSV